MSKYVTFYFSDIDGTK